LFTEKILSFFNPDSISDVAAKALLLSLKIKAQAR
jgi:hypothetical protein